MTSNSPRPYCRNTIIWGDQEKPTEPKPKRLGDIPFDNQRSALVDKVRKAANRAFAETGLPIPDWLDDIVHSVAIDAIDEILDRVAIVEDREEGR